MRASVKVLLCVSGTKWEMSLVTVKFGPPDDLSEECQV